MFTIMGGDGKEYGPVTPDQLRTWITAGRANLDTKARALGSDEWRRLGDFVEFSTPDGAPPPLEPSADDPKLAGRGRRFFGALIDGFLEMLCWTPTSMAVMRTLMDLQASGELDPKEVVAAFTGSVSLSFPYLAMLVLVQAVLLTLRSQSVGKLLVSTRIVRVVDGTPAGFLHGFLTRGVITRFIRQIPLLGGLFWITDACFIFRDDRRCIHDFIAGTRVVKV